MILGWREWVGLPSLKIPAIEAKIDTGARSSSLHTSSYEIFTQDGTNWVDYTLHPVPERPDVEIVGRALLLDRRAVKDSGGHEEERPFIESEIAIGAMTWTIELSLTNRENMKYRMLLGRTGMRGRALVNCEKFHLSGLTDRSAEKLYPLPPDIS
jgi:hypothetical protein